MGRIKYNSARPHLKTTPRFLAKIVGNNRYRMRLIFLISFFLMTNFVFGQKSRFDFGFNLDEITRINSLITMGNTNYSKINAPNLWGFGLGFNVYYKFNEQFQIRTSPGISFESEELIFTRQGADETLKLNLALLRLPIHGIYKPNEKIPMGIILGATPNIQMPEPEESHIGQIKLKKFEFSLDLGLNYKINLPWFSLIPEIRYSKSLINVARDNKTEYGQAITDFYRNRIIFGIYIREKSK